MKMIRIIKNFFIKNREIILEDLKEIELKDKLIKLNKNGIQIMRDRDLYTFTINKSFYSLYSLCDAVNDAYTREFVSRIDYEDIV